MLSIDEAIANAREIAEKRRKDNDNCKYKKQYGCKGCVDYYSKSCIECADECEQLADWFEELSRRRVEELFRKTNEKAIRDKAIDDFQEWIKTQIVGLDNTTNEILVAVDDRWESATDKFKERVSND